MTVGVLRKVFNLYPGEGLKALSFALIALLSAFGAMGGATLLDGQFLEHLGPDALPLTYFWTAFALISMSLILIGGLKLFSPRIFFSILLCGIALFYAACAFSTHLALPAVVWIFFKVVADASILLVLTGLWTVIDGAYDLQDAKRLFGLFSASLILGAAMGSGFVAMGLAQMGVGGLAATFSVALIASCLLSMRSASKGQVIQEESDGDVGWKSVLQQVASSRFTVYLLLFNILLGLIEVVCEFDYMATLTSVFGEGEASGAVTQFLGKARGWVYVGDMVFGMFLYGRLIKRIGINNASLLSAGYFVTLFVAGPPLNGLFIAVLGLIAVEGILPALEDSNFNLLLNAVPQRVKIRFRVAVEYFLQPIGMLGGSLLLVLFQGHAKYVGLGLAIAALVVAHFMRRRYPKAIYDNLKEKGIPFGSPTASYLEGLGRKKIKRLPSHLLRQFPDLAPPSQCAAFELLVYLSGNTPLPQLLAAVRLLKEASVPFAFEILSAAPFANNEILIDTIAAWQTHAPSMQHKGHALLYLAKQGRLSESAMGHYLASDTLPIRGAAILTILKTPDDPRREVASSLHQRLLSSTVEEEISLGIDLLGSLGKARHAAILTRFLRHPSSEIASKACRLLGELEGLDITHLRRIAELFVGSSTPIVRRACLDVLDGRLPVDQIETIAKAVVYLCPLHKRRAETLISQTGTKAVPTLIHIVRSPHYSHAERIFAGRILSKLNLPPLKATMHHALDSEMGRAAFSFYHYHTVQWKGADLTLLHEALWQRYCESVDLTVHLLCASSNHDSHLLCRALRSGDEKTHSHAVETIEKLCPPKLIGRLLPLIDDRPLSDKIRLYIKHGGRALSVSELLANFQTSAYPPERLAAKALFAKRKMLHTAREEELEVLRA